MPPYMLKKGLDHDLYNGAPFFLFSPLPLRQPESGPVIGNNIFLTHNNHD